MDRRVVGIIRRPLSVNISAFFEHSVARRTTFALSSAAEYDTTLDTAVAVLHCGAKKTAPFYFCNNFVKTFCSAIIIGTYILR